ncbi:xanthine dehydrogenase family protein subunit M [Pseudorhodoferax sp. Leaf265]|jgi:carbon-monoxide dehydrogenase medium subunit|uniref:FAD binding domain-containing protein n=1 Tax=Pseudorhodoferax sp. Leaf265 TaxID=1736315 RepID=UPI0006F5E929|nr:xanthine dehydrogenase family protein subunit M [Pseudorhodoferax sp. Leaf265]KQP08978.1 carbon monoxide dehydrogenase [Pseudorhodoferax sp. Leaf265]PZP99714.1 MAG: xanthine dehydrogenase family protein subunit M [Variovorax paradoxus]PZQ11763.1 MAG: xanthine dehydrogenase family protein subunit M [Variovorax paradoxus]
MYAFTIERPASAADAAKLAAAGARPLAGGQTLLASMKLRLADPGQLVDLGGIADLAGIKREGDSVVIGAMTRHLAVADSAEVQAAIPALADLASHIGDRQVRAMGTLGGSVANNDPSACYPSAVLALGATVITTQREIAADDFFTGMFSTALEEGELITAIRFPIPKRAAYLKFKQAASRFALVGVFVAQFDSGVRVAVTGASTCVFRHAELEAALSKSFTPEAAAAVKIDATDLNADIHASAAYRANLVSVQTQRAVAKALG